MFQSWFKRSAQRSLAVVGNRVYDTRRATQIARVQKTQFFDRSPTSYTEALYLTDKGSWFLARLPGQRIIAMTPQEAFQWLCQHHQADILRTHFPDHIEEA